MVVLCWKDHNHRLEAALNNGTPAEIAQSIYIASARRDMVYRTRTEFGNPLIFPFRKRPTSRYDRELEFTMPKGKQLDKNYIAVTGKIFDVLKYLIDKGPKQEPVAFAKMVKALPFSRTTIHRILYSLEKLGYVEKAEINAHYRLAVRFFEFTGLMVHYNYLQSICRSLMNELMDQHMESVNLGVLQNGQVVHIDVIQGRNVLRVAAFPGERNPAHCTALGKAIMAFLPEPELNTILDRLVLDRRTPKTITHKSTLRSHLALVRQRGIAIDAEENLSGVTCIAAPIFNHAGRVIAALSLSGPTSRMNSKLSAMKNSLRASALSATRMIAPLYESEQSSVQPLRQHPKKPLN